MSVKGLLISLQVQYIQVFDSIGLHEKIKSCKFYQFYNHKWLVCREKIKRPHLKTDGRKAAKNLFPKEHTSGFIPNFQSNSPL